MQRDIRNTALFQEAETLSRMLHRPGTGQISEAAEVHASPDGRHAVFAGTLMDKLEGSPPTRICQVDLTSGDTRVLTFGPNTDRLPKYSPDGRHIAFLSDRHKPGDFQLYLLNPASGAVRRTTPVDGWVEYLHWSPDGRRILLCVAGHGADTSAAQGAVTSKQGGEVAAAWMPSVESADESYRWRRAWVYELATDRARQVSKDDCNVWEAVWCGNDTLAAVVSPGPGEGLWFSASLSLIAIDTGDSRAIYTPRDQLGWPAASPSGERLVVVEALCSDRWLVAGELCLIETATGKVARVDTRGVDITHTEWRSDRMLLLAGHRGFETVVAVYDSMSGTFTEVWASQELTTGGIYASVSGLNDRGDCALLGEGFLQAPEIAVIRGGKYSSVRSFDLGNDEDRIKPAVDSVERVRWTAPDGLEIHGWLLLPKGSRPFPLLLSVHGGPVWHWRPAWLGRKTSSLMLLKRGYAIFMPNPRGSSGRGQDFARREKGDLGGAETADHLSGLDHLIEKGIADPQRLGVIGGSHGGFMTSWLICQDQRFAAAVSISPVTHWVTEQLISNIPHFVSAFLEGTYRDPGGMYFQRSPIMQAHRVKTPTLNICGALDRCTPPVEAVQFHNALLENRVKSELVMYPEEGHGVRKWPAAIDYAARIVAWFEDHIGCTVDQTRHVMGASLRYSSGPPVGRPESSAIG